MSEQSEYYELHQAFMREGFAKDVVQDKLSAANAKIAELKTKLAYAEDAAEKGRLARENAGGMEMGIADMEKQNLELTSKVENLTGYLAHEAALNLELEATVEKMREAIERVTVTMELTNKDFFVDAADRAYAILRNALSLTPYSALIAHDLELTERAFRDGFGSVTATCIGESIEGTRKWDKSDTRRSLTEGK